ncbi:hypothetical protein ABT071_36395 [Streptomyces sp. NPDC002506]|uniref:hypothetical protein n=1 Tax=Streptomyces sp. NPDC002506 TaxID=3154536 RepID=UPI003329FE87
MAERATPQQDLLPPTASTDEPRHGHPNALRSRVVAGAPVEPRPGTPAARAAAPHRGANDGASGA